MQSEVPHLAETGGQHMLEETAEELHGLQAGGAGLAGLAVAIAKDDLSVVVVRKISERARTGTRNLGPA